MQKERNILHCDCNSFFASVELLNYPELRNKPVAVGGSEESRHGIILAKNEEAKKYGIKTAQTIYSAKKMCKDLIILPPTRHLYTKYNKILNEIYNSFTDLVEPFGIDESYLDVTNSYHLFAKSPKELADIIREKVKKETGLTISVGVSFNKIFAKLGSDYKKPDATTEITKENYKDIIFPLAVDNMMYVGKSTKKQLEEMGVHTIGDLALTPLSILEDRLGKHGTELYKYANGLDNSPVSSFLEKRAPKSIGSGTTFPKDIKLDSEIKPRVMELCEDVGFSLRKNLLFTNGVQVSIKDTQFQTLQRQTKIPSTNLTRDIYKTAYKLIEENWLVGLRPIRALTITAIDLKDEKTPMQTSLFEMNSIQTNEKEENLQTALDKIKLKYGDKIVKTANSVSNNKNKKLEEN